MFNTSHSVDIFGSVIETSYICPSYCRNTAKLWISIHGGRPTWIFPYILMLQHSVLCTCLFPDDFRVQIIKVLFSFFQTDVDNFYSIAASAWTVRVCCARVGRSSKYPKLDEKRKEKKPSFPHPSWRIWPFVGFGPQK